MKSLVVCAIVVTGCGSSSTSASDVTAPFVGTWNYDQPDRSTGRNIGQVICPSPAPSLVVPQIGDIVFSKTGENTIQGTTDQGCTWNFAVQGAMATLSPPKQTCFNHVIGSGYTLDWSLDVNGAKETEVVTGTSHLPTGDCDFELKVASRTKVDPASTVDPTAAFVGTWSYDPPDPRKAVNIEQVVCGSKVSYAPVLGTLTITKTADHQIQAKTDKGCTWTFSVQGNTAELSPASQSCGGTQSTMTFWSMASDGQHSAQFASRQVKQSTGDCAALLAAGSLTKQ
jgi:hypothetical protein